MAKPIQTKYCPKCKTIKQVSEFFKNRTRKGGYSYQCKICDNALQKSYFASQAWKERAKRYRESEQGKEAQKKYRQSDKGKKVYAKARKLYRAKHKDRAASHTAIDITVASGKLPRVKTLKCHYCGKEAVQYHHWKGYTLEHQLDVVPACRLCDVKDHKKVS